VILVQEVLEDLLDQKEKEVKQELEDQLVKMD
jgi:hypothetical protein